MNRAFAFGLSVAAAALCATPAFAQSDEPDDDRPLIISFGAGVQFTPEFPGSDELKIGPLFTGGARREGDPIPARGPDDGFGFSLTGRGGPVEIGPMIAFQAKRDDDDAGAAIGDVDFAFEPGVFVNLNVSETLRLRAEARRGFGGHEGWQADLGIDHFMRPADNIVLSIGPRLRLADEEYFQTYYAASRRHRRSPPACPLIRRVAACARSALSAASRMNSAAISASMLMPNMTG